jgi:WD40 repeat protein
MSSSNHLKKRDKFFSLFKKDGGALSSAATPSSPAQPNTASSPAAPQPIAFRPYDTFLAAALDKLDVADRAIIQEHYVASNISETIEAAYNGANELKTKIEGTKGLVREKIDKVLILIDKFKAIGDGVSSLDPIHAGLPWAGVKILLSVAVADINQRKALVTGMDLALGISSRLRAYFLYFQRLSPDITTDNFRKALVEVYAQILQFLAQAFNVYKTNPVLRGVRTLWQDATIQDFEKVCDKYSDRLEIEASNCDRFTREAGRIEAAQWRDALKEELNRLDELSNIEHKLQNLSVDVDLSKLTVVASATFNSSEESQQPSCLPSTRVDILRRILVWAEGPDGRSIYWLCGGAGTGKSTISRTIARMLLDKRQLGASFFFKRSHAGRGNADRFFPTIVRQLADRIPALKQPVADALHGDSFLCSNGLEEQFDKLLKAPLMSLEQKSLPQECIVIVIDALDECDRRHIKKFLMLLAGINAIDKLRLRIFVTSRPELPIEINFEKIDGRLHDDYVLETVQAASIDSDLEKYLVHEFAEIRKEWPYDPLPEDWPSQKDIIALVTLAKPLFIYAATVCRFVGEESPRKRLDGILTNKHAVSSLRLDNEITHLQLIYSQVLLEATKSEDADEASAKTAAFKTVVGSILLAADPLSVKALSSILAIDEDEINTVLRPLKSVLEIPRDLTQPVQRRHLSFREYLLDSSNKANEAFRIDEKQTHARLASRCIRFLMDSDVLKQDVCGVKKPGFRRLTMSESGIAQRIPSDIAYACMYWAFHVLSSEGWFAQGHGPNVFLTQHHDLYNFLTTRFLYWLEMMAWLGRYSLAASSVVKLIEITKLADTATPNSAQLSTAESQIDTNNKLLLFLEDARRFVLKFRSGIDIAPLQVYHSAMMFAPTESIISRMFKAEKPDLWDLFPHVAPYWGDDFLVLEGHRELIIDIAFSPEQQMIASADASGWVRLWSLTGELLQDLGRVSGQYFVAFVARGERLLSATRSGLVQVWNTASGERLWDFYLNSVDATAETFCIVLGPSIVWSGANRTLWSCNQEGQQGKLLWTLDETSGPSSERGVDSDDIGDDMDASDDGSDSSSAIEEEPTSEDEAEAEDDQMSYEFENTEFRVPLAIGYKFTSVAISSMNIIAAGTSHGELFIWTSGIDRQPYTRQCHDAAILAITFSTKGDIATSGRDGIVRAWTWSQHELMMRWEAFEEMVKSIAMTSDNLLAHGSGADIVVRDALTGEILQKLRGHTAHVKVVTSLPDGQLVSGAADWKIRLWTTGVGHSKNTDVSKVEYSAVSAMTIAPGSNIVASGHKNGEVRTWDIQSGKELKVFTGHAAGVDDVAVFRNERIIATSETYPGYIMRWWDMDANEERRLATSSPAVAFSLDSKTIAFESMEFETDVLHVFDLQKGEKVCGYGGQDEDDQDGALSLAFSPDGRFLISGHCGYAQIWDAHRSGVALLQLECFHNLVDMVAASTKNVVATACSFKWPMELWNIESGELLHVLTPGADAWGPGQIYFSPNGDMLHTAAGIFYISEEAPSAGHNPKFQPNVLRLNENRDWIQQNGENLLWLPSEAQGAFAGISAFVAISGRTLAIGTSTSGMICFRLK